MVCDLAWKNQWVGCGRRAVYMLWGGNGILDEAKQQWAVKQGRLG